MIQSINDLRQLLDSDPRVKEKLLFYDMNNFMMFQNGLPTEIDEKDVKRIINGVIEPIIICFWRKDLIGYLPENLEGKKINYIFPESESEFKEFIGSL